MRRPCLLAWLVLLLASPAPALELRLEQAVQRALDHNPRLKGEATELEISAERVAIARKEFFPILKAQGHYTLFDRPSRVIIGSGLFGPRVPPEAVEITESGELYTLTLTLSQPLFTGGRLRHTLKKQHRLAEQARLDLSRAEELMTAEVKRAYFAVLNAGFELQTQQYRITTLEEALRVKRELHTEGYVGEEEVLGLESDLAQAQAEGYRLQSRETTALDRFKQLLDLDPMETVVLSEPATYSVADIPLETVRQSALRKRADFASQTVRVEEFEEAIAIARSDLLPQLSLQGGYTVQKETSINRDAVWQAGAVLEWELFDWGQSSAEVRMARALKSQEAQRREDLRRDVLVEVGEAWRLTKEQEWVITARQQRAQAAELALVRALARESEGKLKRSVVMERALDLLASWNEYRVAINNLRMAQAELESAAALSLAEWLSPRAPYAPKIDPLGIRPRTLPVSSQRTSRFVVQLGSFIKHRNAEALKEALKDLIPRGTVEIQSRSRGMHRVWLTGFDTAGEAQSILKKLPFKGYVREVTHAN